MKQGQFGAGNSVDADDDVTIEGACLVGWAIHINVHDREGSGIASDDARRELGALLLREDWEADGGKNIYQRAHARMMDILETYEPPPLPESVRQDIREIVKGAEKEQGVG